VQIIPRLRNIHKCDGDLPGAERDRRRRERKGRRRWRGWRRKSNTAAHFNLEFGERAVQNPCGPIAFAQYIRILGQIHETKVSVSCKRSRELRGDSLGGRFEFLQVTYLVADFHLIARAVQTHVIPPIPPTTSVPIRARDGDMPRAHRNRRRRWRRRRRRILTVAHLRLEFVVACFESPGTQAPMRLVRKPRGDSLLAVVARANLHLEACARDAEVLMRPSMGNPLPRKRPFTW
jgi:hypothetical protein